MIKSIEHVAITVKDFDKSIEWYGKYLGFSVKSLHEDKERGTKVAFLQAGQAMLELFGHTRQRVSLGPILGETETGIRHICFTIDKSVTKQIVQRMRDAGTEFISDDPKFPNFRDPNGVHIQLRPV